MSSLILTDTIDVLRAALMAPAGVDEWNQPAYAADAVAFSGPARIDPLTITEAAALTDAGAVGADYRGTTPLVGIVESDRVRDSAGHVYEVRGVLEYGDHRELLLHRVVD